MNKTSGVLLLGFLAFTAAADPIPESDIYAPGRTIVADVQKIVTPDGVQETFETTLGGARQVVNIRGADRNNPILLYVHGGPGAVEMPLAWTFQRPWEDFFTVVQWDQRGAGRSFPLNDPVVLAPTLTAERYRDDTIELIELLRSKYAKRKIFLLGHSWGSIVGLSVAAKRPDLLYAYIGMGQFIDAQEDEQAGFDWTLDQARKDGNAPAIAELESLRPYPGDFDIDRIDGERKWAVYYGGLFAGRRDGDFYFNAARISPEYTPADRKAWSDGSAYSVKIIVPQFAGISFNNLHELHCPIFLFEGRHDYVIPSAIAAEWLKHVKAPKKTTVWFEHSGHMMMVEEPGKMLEALVSNVLPVATQSDDSLHRVH